MYAQGFGPSPGPPITRLCSCWDSSEIIMMALPVKLGFRGEISMSTGLSEPESVKNCCEQAKIMMLRAGTATLESEIAEYLMLATEWLKLANELRTNTGGEADALASS